MDRWAPKVGGSIAVAYRRTDGLTKLEGLSLLFNRWTDEPIFYVLCSTDGPSTILDGCSFTRETDGNLGVSNGRLTDGTYCTRCLMF